jgi:hypothetical protein
VALVFKFWTKRPEKVAISPELEIDRLAEAHGRVRELKAQLATLDAEMMNFKTKYKIRTNRFSQLLGVECGFAEHDSVATQWRVLLKRRDGLMASWYAALREFADAKQMEVAKNETHCAA